MSDLDPAGEPREPITFLERELYYALATVTKDPAYGYLSPMLRDFVSAMLTTVEVRRSGIQPGDIPY